MKIRNITIVGIGLIGASLALALRKRFPGVRIAGVSRSRRKINFARKRKMIHVGFLNVRAACSSLRRDTRNGIDLVIVCTPIDSIPKIVSRIDSVALTGTVVTDVGSTKGALVAWANRQKFQRIQFVGAHPLAGSHLQGPEHANANLFCGVPVFITPSKKTKPRARKVVTFVWKKLRARVTVLSPDAHDAIASQVSHLPHAVAACLVQTVSPKSLRFSSTGMRHTTRIAQGDPGIWLPIFLSNRKHLVQDLTSFHRRVGRLIKGLEHPFGAWKVRRLLAEAARIRKSLK